MPPACEPLWQVVQFVAVLNALWSTRAPVHRAVLWHVAQLAVVARWLAGLPLAWLPLWQLAQFVAVLKPLWSTLAPVQRVVL